MKKKVKAKAKIKTKAAQNESPDLIAVMTKVAERLEALENKMNLVLSQVERRLDARQTPQPQPQQKPAQMVQHNQNRPSEKRMFQAVCADCKKNCEVPFQPTAERAVYCKECWGKRKSNGHNHNKNQHHNRPAPQMQPRQVKVFRHGGVGKVTISEMLPQHPPRPAPSKKKPVKK